MRVTASLGRIGMTAVLVGGLLAGTTHPAHASAILTMTEVGNDVLLSGSGNLDVTDLTLVIGFGGATGLYAAGGVEPSTGMALLGNTPSTYLLTNLYGDITGPSSFGSGTGVQPTSGTGDRFGLVGGGTNDIAVPVGYVSGSPLSGTLFYANQTFATLGVTPGTYVWSWTNPPGLLPLDAVDHSDSLTLQIGPTTATPEPASLTLLGLGLAGMGARRWRQRNRA
jgi:hypothetical protein